MISRRQFAALAGVGLAAPSLLRAQGRKDVLVIGAGAAGLTAAYHLRAAGQSVTVLEASARWGGRMKRLSGFADVPLDLGAEWIHTDPTVLGQILGAGESDMGVQTIAYDPQTFQTWDGARLRNFNALRFAYQEVKFYDTTWYGFFERFVLPRVADRLRLNAGVTQLAADGPGLVAQLESGEKIAADAAIVTVPLSVLQSGRLGFDARLQPTDIAALSDINFGHGFKVFLNFRDRFYPDILLEGSRLDALSDAWSSKIYYDAALRKPTEQNLLGLFTVNENPLRRATLPDDALIADVLDELAGIFGAEVRDSFLAGHVQNWSKEPWIVGSYSMSNDKGAEISDLLPPKDNRLYFAGEVLGGDNRSTVHGAAFSAIRAVRHLLDT